MKRNLLIFLIGIIAGIIANFLFGNPFRLIFQYIFN